MIVLPQRAGEMVGRWQGERYMFSDLKEMYTKLHHNTEMLEQELSNSLG